MRGASLGTRAVAAIAIEAVWEAYENTDAVIERYRTETISLGYYGDSVINSLADIAACLFGFLLTWRLPRRVTVGWIVAVEVILALWIRDNLFLNILMLVRPLDVVRQWQMGATPVTSVRGALTARSRARETATAERCSLDRRAPGHGPDRRCLRT